MKKIILTLCLAFIAAMSYSQNLTLEFDSKTRLYGFKEEGKKKYVVEPQFQDVAYNPALNAPNGGYVKVKKNNKWGMMDKTGILIIACEYDEIGSPYTLAEKGSVIAKKGGISVTIDKTGKELGEAEFEAVVETYQNAVYFLKKKGKWALADKDKKVLTAFRYDALVGPIKVNPLTYKGTRDGQAFSLDINGQEEGVIESANTNSNSDQKEEKTSCNYKCQKCNKITQGRCNASNTGITVENCTAQQPNPKGPKKNHEWRKQ
ncbi:MAG: WG repeat-containing protein [Bacteroidetes bacterium]|nr:WG repeat-containing protein [Bacteroidota bacterium]